MSDDSTILLLSGPNLNLLGEREPEVYGRATLEEHATRARLAAKRHGFELVHIQSNRESDLVDAVQKATGRYPAVVINAAAFTHYAWALHDALAAYEGVVVELHLSNPYRRESWRNVSVIAPVATGSVAGFGGDVYELAIDAVARMLSQ